MNQQEKTKIYDLEDWYSPSKNKIIQQEIYKDIQDDLKWVL